MDDDQSRERRRAPRYSIGIDVLISSGRDESGALLTNLSEVGALLEYGSFCPPVRATVTIRFPGLFEDESEILRGIVIHKPEDGFGIEFISKSSLVSEIIAKYGRSE